MVPKTSIGSASPGLRRSAQRVPVFFVVVVVVVVFFFYFLGLHLWHMKVPKLGVELEL